MPNIAVLNYCNLKCKYCFADDMIQEKSTSISMDNFKEILEFCSRVPSMNHIGIIGGEPTLHPNFIEIIKEVNQYCRECNTEATLFTNGIELENYLQYIGDRIGILINCNSPEYQGKEQYAKLISVLDHLYDLSWLEGKTNCGCNIYMDCDDYSYFWDIVDKYHLRRVRCSVVSPGGCYHKWRGNKEEYYEILKPKFLQFCKDAQKHNCILGMDCGHIPMCYFTEEEKQLVEETCEGLYQDFCEPVIDITPDFKATSCFGAYDPVDIRDFNDVVELNRFLLINKVIPRMQHNCEGRCTTCQKYDLNKCQGGCLGFSKI